MFSFAGLLPFFGVIVGFAFTGEVIMAVFLRKTFTRTSLWLGRIFAGACLLFLSLSVISLFTGEFALVEWGFITAFIGLSIKHFREREQSNAYYAGYPLLLTLIEDLPLPEWMTERNIREFGEPAVTILLSYAINVLAPTTGWFLWFLGLSQLLRYVVLRLRFAAWTRSMARNQVAIERITDLGVTDRPWRTHQQGHSHVVHAMNASITMECFHCRSELDFDRGDIGRSADCSCGATFVVVDRS